MYYNEEGGDLLGMEIKIVQGRAGFEAVFQEASGVPGPLVIVYPKIEGDVIEFFYVGDSGQKHSLRGRYTDYGRELIPMDPAFWGKLKRRPSYWDEYVNSLEGYEPPPAE
ncbi:MAG: hypothetical protein AB7D51_09180 [Desulfovibrionaceae bacterium]